MKQFRLSSLLPAITAGLLLAVPASTFADRKVTVYRDNDGDGHYNKKTYESKGRYYKGNNYYGGRYYGGGNYYYNRPYYSGYYGNSYPYYRPYYGGPTVSITRYSRPSYGASYSDDLAVEVQRELRRRGYYRGSIDGDVGAGTRAAIRAYQDDRGLSVTGRIDRSLLRSLGIS